MSTLKVDTIQGKTTAGTVAMPAGVIIQTVDFTHGTNVATQSTGYVDTGISAVITPKFSNSKIYITGFLHCRLNGNHDHGVSFKMRRHIGGSPIFVEPLTTLNNAILDPVFIPYAPLRLTNTLLFTDCGVIVRVTPVTSV